MKDWIAEFQDLFTTLIADVEDLSRFAHGGSSQASRSYVRAVFALIEGITYAMKQVAASSSSMSLDAAERGLLNEESYALDPTGNPKQGAHIYNYCRTFDSRLQRWQNVMKLILLWMYQVVGGRVYSELSRLDIA